MLCRSAQRRCSTHVGTRCGCTCADILAVKPLRRRCSWPPQKCHFSMATLLSCWPMSLLVAAHQWILSAHDTHTAQTRFKRLKYTLFQYCRWKWLLAYTPSTRPQSNISTAKSTYIDQITHVSLFAVSTMPLGTASVLNTCRNTMWVHMWHHICLPI